MSLKPPGIYCQLCGAWASGNPQDAQGVMLIHAAEEHPISFVEATGKNPSLAVKEYVEELISR